MTKATKSKKNNKKKISEDMSVFDLSVLMVKQFERFQNSFEKLETFNLDTSENFRLLNTKISRLAEEQEKMNQKIDRINDKANNSFYLGQELNRLEQRVTKLENIK